MYLSRWMAGAAIGCAVLGGCHKAELPQGAKAPAAAVVTVARPIVRDVTEWDEYTGRLDATETVDVRARVSGYVEEVPFKEGAIVKKGDVLMRLDARPFQALLDNMKGQLAQAEAKLHLAKDDLERAQKVKPGVVSAEEIDTREQNVAEAEGVKSSAKAAVDVATLSVEWTVVTAPISGRIGRKYVTPGNLVTGGAGDNGGSGSGGSGGGSGGTLLAQIVSLDPVYCYVDLDEASVQKYQRLARENKRASVRDGTLACYLGLGSEDGFPRQGYLDFVDNRLNASTGTMRARGVFANPDGRLEVGTFARFRMAGIERKGALLVSDAAVGTDQNRKYVLTVEKNNAVVYQLVGLGGLWGDLRIIDSGLTADSRVVVNGLLRARPGATVAPEETAMPGNGAEGVSEAGAAGGRAEAGR